MYSLVHPYEKLMYYKKIQMHKQHWAMMMLYHVTNLKPVCSTSVGSRSTTAHFVVDTPLTGIVCLETLTAVVGWNMHLHHLSIALTQAYSTSNREEPPHISRC